MIEINLIPEADRTQIVKQNGAKDIPWNLILLSLNGILLTILLLVTAVNVGRIIRLKALSTRLNGLAPEQQKILAVQQKIKQLKSTNAMFSTVTGQGFLWSKTLNRLSDLLVPGIWFRQISSKKKEKPGSDSSKPKEYYRLLTINGTVVAVNQDEMSVIGKFIREVKDDPYLKKNFDNVELESVFRKKISDVEVMDFILVCNLKQN